MNEAKLDTSSPGRSGLPSGPFFTDAARAAITDAVASNLGQEVFFLGRAREGIVEEVEDVARGNAHMVPVLRNLAASYDVAIHNHPSGDLTPSDADLHVAAELGDLGCAFYIVSNDAKAVNPVVKLFPEQAPPPPVSASAIERAFGEGGGIAKALDRFEPRQGQLDMAQAVGEALTEGSLALIEAGTGTGKSLAYLVPALLRARTAPGEKVVVATNTINLQEQLLQKDIPLVRKAWAAIKPAGASDEPPRAVLMKGRSHYACLKRIEDLSAMAIGYFESQAEEDEVHALMAWAANTQEGARQELSFQPSVSAWDKVSVDPDLCDRTACSLYQECFYFKARREATSADLIVANHALLMADIAIRRDSGFTWGAVLPPYRHLIVDEAHHLEDAAIGHLGHRLSSLGLLRALGRLRSARRGNKGILPALAAKAATIAHGQAVTIERLVINEAEVSRSNAAMRIELFFDEVRGLLDAIAAAEPAGGHDSDPAGSRRVARIKPQHQRLAAWDSFTDAARLLATELRALGSALKRIHEAGQLLPDEDRATLRGLLAEIKAGRSRVLRNAMALSDFADGAKSGGKEVRWIEHQPPRGRGRERLYLRSAPLEVASLLRRDVYPQLGAVILTSATLAISGSFDYVEKRLGLTPVAPESTRREPTRPEDPYPWDDELPPPDVHPEELLWNQEETDDPAPPPKALIRHQVPSPFDYTRQGLLALVSDLPSPQSPSFERALPEAVVQLALASQGGCFFLFTSHRQLQRVYEQVSPELNRAGLFPMRQGLTSRRELIAQFRRTEQGVLFGTDSFWEGVDVPGRALRMVVIVKLPFRVPSEPIQEARIESIEQNGGSAFNELSLPQAVLRLKQGVGRLIRHREDHGAVVILDRRLIDKRYGFRFLTSLPPFQKRKAPLARVCEMLREG
ncbi:MAG: helicase C-terminal domain-containing protein [Planctomycetota bacterium]